MKISPKRLSQSVSPGYSHTGKFDYDTGHNTTPLNQACKRTMRAHKKKQRRLLDKLTLDDDTE